MSDNNNSNSNNSNSKIFVGNVSFQCTKDDFQKCFAVMDGYVDSNMATKYNSLLSRGYGVITFDTEENAKKMLDKNISLYDRELRFNVYEDRSKSSNTNSTSDGEKKYEKSFKIYVAHPVNELDDDTLKNVFNQFGTINVFYTKTDVKGQKYSIIGFTERDPIHNALNTDIIYENVNVLVRPFKRRNNNRQFQGNYRSDTRRYNNGNNRQYDGQNQDQPRHYNNQSRQGQYNGQPRQYNNQPRQYNSQPRQYNMERQYNKESQNNNTTINNMNGNKNDKM